MPVDLNSIKKTDLGALIAGALALVLSVFPSFVRGSVEGGSGETGLLAVAYEEGITAWHGAGALAMLLVLVATALIAVKVFAPQALPSGVPVNLIAAALAGLGTLILALRLLTSFESQEAAGIKVSQGPGWSGILLLLATIALTVFAALGFKESGEALPWNNQGGASTGGHATEHVGGHADPMGGTTEGTTGDYAAPRSGAAAAPPPNTQQPSVQPTTPQPGAPMPPPSGGAPMSQPPQAPAPGTPAPGAPGSGSVPPPGEEQPRSY